MALDDIKQAILDEAKKEASKIENEGEKKISEVTNQWQDKLEEKKAEILSEAKLKATKKLQQASFEIKAQSQTEALKAKQKVIDKTYKQVLDKLSNLDEKEYVDLIVKLIKVLPDPEGEIISAKGKFTELKKAIEKSGKEYNVGHDGVSGGGGFIFKSQSIDIDNTFSTLVNNLKEETSLEVSKILFEE